MRALFFALVLANLAFFGWARWIDVRRPAVTASLPDKGVPTLALAQPAPVPARPSSGAASAQRCRTLGPFSDQASAQAAAALLRARGIAPSDRTAASNVEDGYWVYIGDLNDADAQRSALSRLEKAGIRDAAVMTDAGDAGRVSVGIFNEQARAVRRAEQVRALGFKPILDLHQRMQRSYWLDMLLRAEQPEPPVSALQSQGAGSADSEASAVAFADCPAGNKRG